MSDEVAEFWRQFETETGEKVAARCLGQYFPEAGDGGLWGLLVLTDKSFRFRETPSDNLVFGLFKKPAKAKDSFAPVDLAIPLGAIASVDYPRRKGLARLFASGMTSFSVRERETDKARCFEADLKTGFIEALEKAVTASSLSEG